MEAEFDLGELTALVNSSGKSDDDPTLQSKREMLHSARNWLDFAERAVPRTTSRNRDKPRLSDLRRLRAAPVLSQVRLDGEEPFKRLCAALAEGDAWELGAVALVRKGADAAPAAPAAQATGGEGEGEGEREGDKDGDASAREERLQALRDMIERSNLLSVDAPPRALRALRCCETRKDSSASLRGPARQMGGP